VVEKQHKKSVCIRVNPWLITFFVCFFNTNSKGVGGSCVFIVFRGLIFLGCEMWTLCALCGSTFGMREGF